MRDYLAPNSLKQEHLRLTQFGGVDFFSEASQVDPRRSPDAKNMIADSQFFPVKRTGYKKMAAFSGKINGIFGLRENRGGSILVHAGKNLYAYDPTEQESALLYSGMADAPSSAFAMNSKLYLLDSKNFLCWDGNTAAPVSQDAYVPTTRIGRHATGGGQAFESPNLLTGRRRNSFTADGASTVYHLDAQGLDAAEVSVLVDGTALAQGTDYQVNRTAGTITFVKPPADDAGADSIEVTFSKTQKGALEKILGCTVCSVYGGKNNSCAFVSGNSKYPNTDWHSAPYDPTYFPEDSFTRIGADSSAIVGYIRQHDAQIILKECGDDAGQYLRTSSFDGEKEQIFPIQQGSAGIGAVSSRAMGILEDEPLFLSDTGVYACGKTQVKQELALQRRSRRIDRHLTAQPGLKEAAAIAFGGKFYLSVGGRCYVADSRQKYRDDAAGTSYEWYYWDNIPARCFLEWENRLYFGTADGRLCRFCLPQETGAYLDDGDAIDAWWKTPMLHFGSHTVYKNIRNVAVTAMPYARSGMSVYYSSDEEWMRLVYQGNIDLFSWENLDFSRFSFRSIPAPFARFTGERSRHITVFQVTVRNAQPDEPFGLLGLQIDYTIGGGVR